MLKWDDVHMFLATARHGSFSGAADALRLSQPTVSRRVRTLETVLGTRLFDRLPDGLALTAEGMTLLPRAHAMENGANDLLRVGDSLKSQIQEVRISCDDAVGRFIALRMDSLAAATPNVALRLSATDNLADLSRREAEILIRQCLPDGGNFVTRRLVPAEYAIYGDPKLVEQLDLGTMPSEGGLRSAHWIAVGVSDLQHPENRKWIDTFLGRTPDILVNNEAVALDIVRSGAGLSVLPCFLADTVPGLERIGHPIETLAQKYWIMTHRDLSKIPALRGSMDAIVRLFTSRAELG